MTFWVAGAAIVGTVGGALINKNATKNAVNSQVQSSADSTAESARQYDQTRTDQLRLYDQTRADQLAQLDRQRADWLGLLDQQRTDVAPYREQGYNALRQLGTGLAPGGEFTKNFTLADFTVDPGYQYRLSEGTKGINSALAARALKELTRFNQGLASQGFGDAYNRFKNDQSTRFNYLASMAGIGQTANGQTQQAGTNAYGAIGNAGTNAYGAIGSAGTNAYGNIAGAGANYTNAVSNNLIGAGNARASGYIGGANAITGAIGQGLNFYQNMNMLNSLRGGGSSPSFSSAYPNFLSANAGILNQGVSPAELYGAF
jgi:hypothetical protein